MTHRYLPQTEEDTRQMLDTIGVSSVEELFSDIPKAVRTPDHLPLKRALKEGELVKTFRQFAAKNADSKTYTSFLGAGVYDHYIPSVVDSVISRSEFYTAYTPYQPEISQGELQAIFEFQTMICELTGMDVANSSMYDGPTALAEAAMLAAGQTKRHTLLVSDAVHPQAKEVITTYAKGQYIDVKMIPLTEDGTTDLEALEGLMSDDTAAVIVQYPNFFGRIEPMDRLQKLLENEKALFIASSNPLALGCLTPPGAFGCDIVAGDAQVFGIPQSFGGPHCGYFAVKSKFMRKVPGRLVGQTVDEQGRRGFVLTLQAREQHIRRDKATSNICSNQALNALAASVAMSALGKDGVVELAKQNAQKAYYAKRALLKAGVRVITEQPTFHEFVIELNRPVSEVNDALFEKGIIGGYDLGNVRSEWSHRMLVAVTEQRTKNEIHEFVEQVVAIDGN